MVVTLAPDQSVVVYDRRLINRSPQPVKLVILREPQRIQVDTQPYPKKPEKSPGQAN